MQILDHILTRYTIKYLNLLLLLGAASLHASYPVEPPYTEGYLQVSEKHHLYYATYGNPEGVPVVILHGGPGAGCKDDYTQFFDLKLWRVVMFDQRGAMRSTPFASMEENTPQNSILDIEALRKHLGIRQWAVFGNSWGSCLALLYGQAHADSCLGFILEGTFLAREQDIGFFKNMGKYSRGAFDELLSHIPVDEQNDFPKACHKKVMDPDPAVHMAMARALMRCILLDASNPPAAERVEKMLSNDRIILSCMRAIAHYAYHQCFLEPNQLLSNMAAIQHLPGYIVHGALDSVNPPEQAHDLHTHWKNSTLCIIEGAGHSCFEPAIATALANVTDAFLLNCRYLDVSPSVVRELRHRRIFHIDAPSAPVGSIETVELQPGTRNTPIRIYTPASQHTSDIILFIHGGGWIAGSLDTHDNLARYLCSNTNARVVSVGYTASPEGKFPLPLEQCYDALLWAKELAGQSKIAVVGDSAGGNMAAALTLMARERGGPQISLQVLINPALDLTCNGTLEPQGDALDTLRWEVSHYLSNPAAKSHPYVSPLQEQDLSNLPPATIILAENDLLRPQGQLYADRLSSAGIPTSTYCQKNTNHLAGHAARASLQAKESLDIAVQAINAALKLVTDEQMLQKQEDEEDIRDADAAIKYINEGGETISHEQMKKELGL